ncbi:MAG: DUF2079 domain-containing protein [Nitrospinales bacterium]
MVQRFVRFSHRPFGRQFPVWFFFLEKRGRVWPAVFLAVLLAFVKEPFALQTAACGLYLLAFRKQPLPGTVLVFAGLSLFFLATQYIQPYFSMGMKGALDSSAFLWLGQSLSEMVWFLVSKPHLVLAEILTRPEKRAYLFYLFGALAFLPLLNPKPLLVALPILGISLLSTTPNHYGYMNHYTAGIIAPLVIAFSESVPRAKRLWSRIRLPEKWFSPLVLVIMLIFHLMLAPSPIGRHFWNQNGSAYSPQAYLPTERDEVIKTALLKYVPSDPNIVVSAQNSLNWNYLAHRKYFFLFPFGVFQPIKVMQDSDRTLTGLWNFFKTGKMTAARTEEIWADYVVLDLKRPWFIGDEGCSWKNGQCKNNGEFSSRFLALVEQTKERFDTVFQKDGFYILKRKHLPAALR